MKHGYYLKSTSGFKEPTPCTDPYMPMYLKFNTHGRIQVRVTADVAEPNSPG